MLRMVLGWCQSTGGRYLGSQQATAVPMQQEGHRFVLASLSKDTMASLSSAVSWPMQKVRAWMVSLSFSPAIEPDLQGSDAATKPDMLGSTAE